VSEPHQSPAELPAAAVAQPSSGLVARIKPLHIGVAALLVFTLALGYLVGSLGGSSSAAAANSIAAGGGSAVAGAVPGDSASSGDGRPASALSAPVKIQIPTMGVSGTLGDLHLNPDGTLQVPTDYQQVGWYADGAVPGDTNKPPVILAGHVDSLRGPAVFYDLKKLAMGDQVRVTQADGKVAVYTVYAAARYPKTKFPADTVYAPRAASEIVLITCTGAFDKAARSYEDNLVVSARLDPALSSTAGS